MRRGLPPMCSTCTKANHVVKKCKVLVDPWHFYNNYSECFAYSSDPDWEKKVSTLVAAYKNYALYTGYGIDSEAFSKEAVL